MSITVRVEGLREVQSALREILPDRTARAVMTRVLTKRAQKIADRATELAPVDPDGVQNLKKSIGVSKSLRKSQRSSSRTNPDDVTVYVGPSNVETNAIFHYAHLQEFGSSVHGPQPYMRPAWDGAQSTLLQGIGDDLWDEIAKAAKRQDKKAGIL